MLIHNVCLSTCLRWLFSTEGLQGRSSLKSSTLEATLEAVKLLTAGSRSIRAELRFWCMGLEYAANVYKTVKV